MKMSNYNEKLQEQIVLVHKVYDGEDTFNISIGGKQHKIVYTRVSYYSSSENAFYLDSYINIDYDIVLEARNVINENFSLINGDKVYYTHIQLQQFHGMLKKWVDKIKGLFDATKD